MAQVKLVMQYATYYLKTNILQAYKVNLGKRTILAHRSSLQSKRLSPRPVLLGEDGGSYSPLSF
jgi:hypothetical protein